MGVWSYLFLGIFTIVLILGIVFLILYFTNKTKYAKYKGWGFFLTAFGFLAIIAVLTLSGIYKVSNSKIDMGPYGQYNSDVYKSKDYIPQTNPTDPYYLGLPTNFNPLTNTVR